MIAKFDVEKTEETKESFKELVSAACDLLTKSTQAKHIVSSKLICESFRRAMEMDPPAEGEKEKETVAYALA